MKISYTNYDSWIKDKLSIHIRQLKHIPKINFYQYFSIINISLSIVYVSENNSESMFSRRKIFRKLRHPRKLKDNSTCYTLILAFFGYIIIILFIYLQDMPRFGGTDRTCKRFHYIPPESTKSNSTYPFPNTGQFFKCHILGQNTEYEG